MLDSPGCHTNAKRGFALLEALVSLGLVTAVFVGLALFMGRLKRAVSVASSSSTPPCETAACSADDSAILCECGDIRWRSYR